MQTTKGDRPVLISPREAAQILGCSERTVRDRLKRGALRGFKQGHRWRIRRRDVERTPARRAAASAHDDAIRAAVERTLPSRAASPAPRHGALDDVDVFRSARSLLADLGDEPSEARQAIVEGLLAIGEAHAQFDRAVKLAAVNRARAAFGRAVAALLLTSGGVDDDTKARVERLEGDVLRRLGGFARWVDGLPAAGAA